MRYFYISISIVNLGIIGFNLLKFTRNFLLLRANFKDGDIDLWSFLKSPDDIYKEAIEKMDELQMVLVELIDTVHKGEELILDIDLIHKEIKEKLMVLEDMDRLDLDIKNKYDELNNVFNEVFDSSQVNIQESYDLMDQASEYLKRG